MPSNFNVIYIPQWISFQEEQGVIEYARQAGWRLSSTDNHGGDIYWVRNRRPDGIITRLYREDSAHVRFVREAGVPVVDTTNTIIESPAVRVLSDNVAIGRMGADHLIDQGFRHLSFSGMAPSVEGSERERGFAERVNERGCTYHSIFEESMFERKYLGRQFESVVREFSQILDDLPKPLGLMIRHDGLQNVVSEACNKLRLTIPDDVAVVGVGHTQHMLDMGEMPLTCVDPNFRRLGYEAAALLDRLMNGEPAPTKSLRVKPLRVVVRRSSDVLSVKDVGVRRALNFMHEHYQDASINVDEISKATGTSRRRLYTLFEEHMGLGIREMLTRIRVQEAQRLLVETDLKILSIAMNTGFSGPEQLIRSFSREVGTTPGEFRKHSSSR